MGVDYTAAIRAKPHDKAAWEDWFKAVYPRVFYYIYRRSGGDTSLSEEVTQSAIERFLRYRAIKRVRSDNDAVAYLIKTCLRLYSDERKHQTKEQAFYNAETESTALSATANRSARLDLERLLGGLSDPDRELIKLVLEGHSVSEIAEKLDISYSTAGLRIHRARKRLKKLANAV